LCQSRTGIWKIQDSKPNDSISFPPPKKSDKAKRCDGSNSAELKSIEGFTCPGSSEIGPNGLLQEHPVFPHPTDCQYFFTCFFGKEPNKFGCSNGQVFDAQVICDICGLHKLLSADSDCNLKRL